MSSCNIWLNYKRRRFWLKKRFFFYLFFFFLNYVFFFMEKKNIGKIIFSNFFSGKRLFTYKDTILLSYVSSIGLFFQFSLILAEGGFFSFFLRVCFFFFVFLLFIIFFFRYKLRKNCLSWFLDFFDAFFFFYNKRLVKKRNNSNVFLKNFLFFSKVNVNNKSISRESLFFDFFYNGDIFSLMCLI